MKARDLPIGVSIAIDRFCFLLQKKKMVKHKIRKMLTPILEPMILALLFLLSSVIVTEIPMLIYLSVNCKVAKLTRQHLNQILKEEKEKYRKCLTRKVKQIEN